MSRASTQDEWQALVEQLRGVKYQFGLSTAVHRIQFEPGLTDSEVAHVERQFGFTFPPDLRGLLQTALPHGPQFPDWRHGPEPVLREWLEEPREGILFDVEHNDIWLDAWGPKPSTVEAALQRINELVSSAPRLIPVYSHRMIPEEPHEAGNPVFSVHQADIICYGIDLESYLRTEFELPDHREWHRIKPIRFWSSFLGDDEC